MPTGTTTADLSTGNTGDTDDGGSGGGIVMIVVIVIFVVIAATIGVTMWFCSKRLKIPSKSPGALTPNPVFATKSSAPVYGSLDPQKVHTLRATSGDQSYAMLQRKDGAAASATSVYAEDSDGEAATSVYAIPSDPALFGIVNRAYNLTTPSSAVATGTGQSISRQNYDTVEQAGNAEYAGTAMMLATSESLEVRDDQQGATSV